MTTFPQAVDRTAELSRRFLPQIVTISDSTQFPVKYKRVTKPRIKRMSFGIWLCASDPDHFGKGYSPTSAYTAWHRNYFLPERR